MHQSPAGPAGAKAASLVPAIRAGSTGQPNLCQHSLDIRPENRFAACNPSAQAQRVLLSVAKDLNRANLATFARPRPLPLKGNVIDLTHLSSCNHSF